MTEKKKLGVVLFQLGGPDSPDAVEPFLYNLFCDPDIIDFFGAWFARRPLARYIARKRAGVVREIFPATFPSGEGSDLAGVVEEVGAGVRAWPWATR